MNIGPEKNPTNCQSDETKRAATILTIAGMVVAAGAAEYTTESLSSLVREGGSIVPKAQIAAIGNIASFTDSATSLNLQLTSAKENPQHRVIKYGSLKTDQTSNFKQLNVRNSTNTVSNAERRKIWYDAFSPQIGKGLPKSEKLTLRSILVTAGMRYNVSPNFLACFYYLEHPRPGDSTNEDNAAVGAVVTGNGRWRRLARPYGKGGPYPTNPITGAAGPFSFMYRTWLVYGVDGNHDGKKDPNNLEDGANGAARYIAASGGTRGASRTSLYNAAFSYNPSSIYAAGAIRTYELFKSRVEK